MGGGRVPWFPPPFGSAYAPIEENKKGVRKFFARFLAFSKEISTVQKIVLSSRPRTSSRTPPLVANTSSFAAGKSCQSWIMISASILKGRKKERKFLQSASLVSLQRRLCLTRRQIIFSLRQPNAAS